MAETKTARAARSNGVPHARTREDETTTTHTEGPPASVCPVAFCPICTAVSAVNRASPEVVQHLLLAGQQFLMALKAVVDARVADFDGDADVPGGSMERIDIA